MYGIGIDIGSTFTKYCIMSDKKIIKCFSEKTPVKQRQYFEDKIVELEKKYPNAVIISCGYGKSNISSLKQVNELIALAIGSYYINPNSNVILDIGGQDTKIIKQKEGKLLEFFLNDKCAAGSGIFLINTMQLLELKFEDIKLLDGSTEGIKISSVCAVFAQSEITEMIADNIEPLKIMDAVLKQVLIQAKKILNKVETSEILLSGGLTLIPHIETYATKILGIKCNKLPYGNYMSAIGCASLCFKEK